MIILDESDEASVHTLVQLPASDTNVNSKPVIPWFLTPLTFASFVFSVPPFVLSLLSFSISRIHTIPTFIAFVFGIPFHVGTFIIISRLPFCTSPSANLSWRVHTIAYVTVLLSLWTCGATMTGLALAGRWKISDCSPTSQSVPTCPEKTLIVFIVSTTISVIEVIILGTIIITLCRWDLFDSRTASRAHTPMSPTLQSAYWKVPLVFASLIFTAPPLALAILTTTTSSLTLYSIPTIIAYIFTTPFHIGITIMWRISCRTPHIPFNALTTKRCVTVVFSLTALWIFSTIVGGRFAGHPKLLDGTCVTRHGREGKCEAQMQLYFVASAISTALEALILGVTFVMALLPLLRKDKNETDSSSPTRHMATFKGPTRVRSEGV